MSLRPPRRVESFRHGHADVGGAAPTPGSAVATCYWLGMSELKVEHAERRVAGDGHALGETVVPVDGLVVPQRDGGEPADDELFTRIQRRYFAAVGHAR
jgi:hypothetical protein